MGMPLYMEPNFEDLSCKMVFGQTPPPLEQDDVMGQPCFKQCAVLSSYRVACQLLVKCLCSVQVVSRKAQDAC